MEITVTKESMDNAKNYLAELFNTNSYETTLEADEIAIELATDYSIETILYENGGRINTVAQSVIDDEDYLAWNHYYYDWDGGMNELLEDLKSDAQIMSDEMDMQMVILKKS